MATDARWGERFRREWVSRAGHSAAFGCWTDDDTDKCRNSITRVRLEDGVVLGLKDGLMAPDMVDEVIRSLVEEADRLNRARRAGRSAKESQLAKIDKGKTDIVDAIESGR